MSENLKQIKVEELKPGDLFSSYSSNSVIYEFIKYVKAGESSLELDTTSCKVDGCLLKCVTKGFVNAIIWRSMLEIKTDNAGKVYLLKCTGG